MKNGIKLDTLSATHKIGTEERENFLKARCAVTFNVYYHCGHYLNFEHIYYLAQSSTLIAVCINFLSTNNNSLSKT